VALRKVRVKTDLACRNFRIQQETISHTLQNTSILSDKSRYTDPIIRKGAIETQLHHNNISTEEGLFLNKSEKSLFYSLKEGRKSSSENYTMTYLGS
jgi:hypothetical protein